MPADEPERFFLVHLQKTAGTTLLRRLRHHFGAAAIYPDATDGSPPDSVLLVEHLEARFAARREEIRVVTGHFPLAAAEVLGVPFTTLTVLRDPVERTLSFLRHHRRLVKEDAERPLEDIYADPLRFHGLIHNHMVKMLGLLPAEMTAGAMTMVDFTPAFLERAKERLATIDAIGLQDRFDDYCEGLERRFGWDLGEPHRSNATKPVEVDDAFVARIADDNALDVELYEYACRLVDERAAGG